MKFIINETGKVEELHIYTRDHIDWTEDLIGNSGDVGRCIQFDNNAGAYRISQEHYDWWADYIEKAQADQDELDRLRAEYGVDAVDTIIFREGAGQNCDYECHHSELQKVFRVIRAELVA